MPSALSSSGDLSPAHPEASIFESGVGRREEGEGGMMSSYNKSDVLVFSGRSSKAKINKMSHDLLLKNKLLMPNWQLLPVHNCKPGEVIA